MKYSTLALAKKTAVLVSLTLATFFSNPVFGQTYETFPTGSFIVNMGVTPQTVGNGLKPYGLLYDLILNYSVPIKWVINPGKSKDGIDFSYGGTDYKGGPFIIDATYRTPSVNARIAYWQSLGVVGTTTTSPLNSLPVAVTLKAAPKWTMDQQNGSIAIGFFANAGIPASAYGGSSSSNWKLPAQLNCCDDLFVMPHADPTWATHSNLFFWNQTCKGGIWLGCHSGSAQEDMFNPGNPSQQTNFLAEKTGIASGGGPYFQNALLLWGSHSDGTLPYSYDYPTEPVMQFMGILDAATQNGSEQVYIPLAPGWRPTTKVGVYDPDHAQRVSNNVEHRPAILAWGDGFGDPARGEVMMIASHSINKATLPVNIAAQRAFFNWSFMTANERAIVPDVSVVPDTMISGVGVTLSYDLPLGVDSLNYTTQWAAACGGTFSPNANQKTVVYTPPAVTGPTSCPISVQISDACGRKFSNSKPVVIMCGLVVTASSTNPTCFGAANGTISMAISGASGPFTWSWSRTTPAGTGNGAGTTINGLTAGAYQVTLTAANGCNKVFALTLTQPTALNISSVITNVLCNGNSTGAINLSVSGGTPGYAYNWGGGIISEDRSALSAGTYTVTVTDSQGCTGTFPSTVIQASAIQINPVVTHVNCFGQNTGAITLNVTGGVGPYSYNWGDGPTSQNRSSLSAGTYQVTVTDANSCPKTASINLTQPAAALSLSTSATNIICGGGLGAINLTVSGGTTNYTYVWAGGPTSEDRSNLSAGNYTVTVTDANSCTAITSASVSATSAPNISPNVTHVLCFGGTGGIDLTVTGAGPFTYSWADGSTAEDRTNLTAGNYTVTVTSSEGCASIANIAVNGPSAALGLSASMTNIACNGASTGAIDLSVSGGTVPYIYIWSNGAVTQDISGLPAGNYTVTVTDANDCVATLNKTLTQPAGLSLSTTTIQASCPPPVADGAIDLEVSGGNMPYSYDWDNDGFEFPDNDNQDITGLAAGSYQVIVTDASGCSGTTTVVISNLNGLPNPPSGVNH